MPCAAGTPTAEYPMRRERAGPRLRHRPPGLPRRQQSRPVLAAELAHLGLTALTASALRSQRLPPRSPLPSLDSGPLRRYQPLADPTSRRHRHLSGKTMARNGPYRAGPAPLTAPATAPEAEIRPQETATETSFSALHHLRRSRRVGRTAAGPAARSSPCVSSPSVSLYAGESYPHLSCLALPGYPRDPRPADGHQVVTGRHVQD